MKLFLNKGFKIKGFKFKEFQTELLKYKNDLD